MDLAALKDCTQCVCRSEALQVVLGQGPADADVVVLGQNPGEEENVSGVPFVGRGGKLLDQWLYVLGMDRQRCWVTNTVKCHTTGNRVPRKKEVDTCLPWFHAEALALPDLQVVFALGRVAARGVLGNGVALPGPMDAAYVDVGFAPGRKFHLVVLPHPAYLLRFSHLAPQLRTLLEGVREYLRGRYPDLRAWRAA